jgi:lysophospholipase L1-like esterase
MLTRSMLSCVLLLVPTSALLAGNETDYTYLALGDSIAYGLNPTLLNPAPPLPTPSQFTGYPEIVAKVDQMSQSKKEVNASCPGETSGSFWIAGAPDNGCSGFGPMGQPPFKTVIGLHTNYSTTQLAFAVSQLASNKHITLVTLGIGGNDLLLVAQKCAADPATFEACVVSMLGIPPGPGVLQSYAVNLTTILTAIRANYSGKLVLVTNYSPSADPLFTKAIGALNFVATQVGANFGVRIADGFTAFQVASALDKSDPCAAGLLIRLTTTACDVDPSPLGRDLLAATVVLANQDKVKASKKSDASEGTEQ